MTQQQAFGGPWTQDKLQRLGAYLLAYMQALKNQRFRKIYVDAFAGTGERKSRSSSSNIPPAEYDEPDMQGFLRGSPRIALEVQPPFDHYLFIERSTKKCRELQSLKAEYPQLAARIQIENAEANQYLRQWCKETNWRNARAVVFLDPFGMQVEWTLLEAIAATKAIDLWLLVPLGMGVNRLLTQNDLPPEDWAARLTTFFGTEDWKEEFYQDPAQLSFFGERKEKNADYERIKAYFVKRLKTIFAGVAPKPLTQRNSKNSPLFLLCFVSSNPSGAPIALRIAHHLLKEETYGD